MLYVPAVDANGAKVVVAVQAVASATVACPQFAPFQVKLICSPRTHGAASKLNVTVICCEYGSVPELGLNESEALVAAAAGRAAAIHTAIATTPATTTQHVRRIDPLGARLDSLKIPPGTPNIGSPHSRTAAMPTGERCTDRSAPPQAF